MTTTASATPTTPKTPKPEKALPVITSVAELAVAVGTAARQEDTGARMYSKSGFKGFSGLEGLDNVYLAVMAGAIIQRIAVNGGDGSQAILIALSDYTEVAGADAKDEAKARSLEEFAKEDFNLTRLPGESAKDFLVRFKVAASSATSKTGAAKASK